MLLYYNAEVSLAKDERDYKGERDSWKSPVLEHLQMFGVTVPPWLFWSTIVLILVTITLETLEAWSSYAGRPFLLHGWLALTKDKFQTPLSFALCYVPVGLGIQQLKEEVNMRFFNREATMEKARAYGRGEGRAEGRIEGRAEGRIEGRDEARAELNQAWESWLQRREAAAERNEPFNEPPPSQVQS